MTIQPFSINVPDQVLSDLQNRLAATRWPDALEDAGWEYGTNLEYLQSLVAYWREGYDWRKQEALLNQLPHYRVNLDGFNVHFIHQRGKGPNPMPIIITHGWPGSFLEMVKILPLLTDPAAHGGDARDAFDVVIPSLPGYGFSDRPGFKGMHISAIAALWVRLMTGLGYDRFAAQGGDLGSAVSSALGLEHPEHITGIHLNYLSGRRLLQGLKQNPENGPVIDAFNTTYRTWWDNEGGYNHLQSSKPQTPAYGLNDSPAGLAAWILEKFRTWSDCGGDVESVFTRDQLLTNIMVYWVTQTIHSSFRLYYESRMTPLPISATNRITPPVGVAHFPKEIPMAPRALAEWGYNITRWTEMPRGGHFAALEQPDLLVSEIREFFRPLR